MFQSFYKKQIIFVGITILISVSFLIISAKSEGQTVKKSANVSDETISRPNWIGKEPLVIVGSWDDVSIFRLRRGGSPLWEDDDYIKGHTEEAVKKLKDLGVTMAVIHYFKGFGMEAEKDQLEDAKRLTALCKKYGIKVGVYIASTISYETFLLEKPDAEEWFVPDYMGKPVRYPGTQTFRKRVYFMHPEYIKYIKEVIRIAIEDMKVDLIHFDNTSYRGEPEIFFHPMAIKDFRTYLRKNYTAEVLNQRLGFSQVDYIEPPKYDKKLRFINDPLFQLWAEFRCHQINEFYGEMRRYIRKLNPQVAVECNPANGLSGRNTIWEQGIDYPELLRNMDIVWSEEGIAATAGDGALISKIRTLKAASKLNNSVFFYTYYSKLHMAEAMAYNRQCFGMVGTMLAGWELLDDRREYIKFYHDNFDYYKDIDNVADVAVLRSFHSMAFNNDRPYQSTYLFEQALIQAKVPFDIIYDQHLKDLSKYRVLVLADQECLTDENIDLIRKFVNSGGGLVATEHTSLYTQWRRMKRGFALNDLFQVETPQWTTDYGKTSYGNPAQLLKTPIKKNEVGAGRVVYIPEIKPAIEKPSGERMSSQYWKLPFNWKKMIDAVKWAAKDDLSIDVNAPLTVTMELTQKNDKSCMMLHLLNYNFKEEPQLENITVSLKLRGSQTPKEVTLISPDEKVKQSMNFNVADGKLIFTIPSLKVYTMAAIRFK